MVRYAKQRFIGMKHMASAEKNSKSRASSARAAKYFAVCVKNKGYSASLERRKIYAMIPDTDASRLGHVRIKDESGEDYLYPAEYFVPIKLSASIQSAFSRK